MKKMRRIVALLLAAAMFTSLFAGCGKKDSEAKDDDKEVSSEADSDKEAEDDKDAEVEKEEEGTPEKLTIWVEDNIRIEDWETNNQTVWLEEQLGFDLEIIPLASDGYAEKINVALTTGSIEELPDVILGGASDSKVWSWAQAGSIIPLTDYYKDPELSVNIQEAIERTGVDYTQQIVSPDGNIYAVATYNQSYANEFPARIWLYEPWLKELGAEVPTTTDELYELLKQVVSTDLNGNGKADEIGILGTELNSANTLYYWFFQALMNAFVYAGDAQFRTVEDGVVSAAYTTDEWKEGLKYIKKLFDEGLILQESLTMSDDQFKTLMNVEEDTVFMIMYSCLDMVDATMERRTDYVYIDTLTGPDGVNYAVNRPSVANPSFVVTANCDYPEAAFRLGDLLSSEYMGITTRWGEEGVNWDYPENIDAADLANLTASVPGFDISIVVYDDGTFWGGTDLTNGSWRQKGPYVRQYGLACGMGINASGDKYMEISNGSAVLYQTADHEPEEVIPKLIFTTEESEAIAEIESLLYSYVLESTGAFLTGTKDIDKDWDAYLKELENIGVSTYIETVQTVYDRMYK